MALVAHTDVGLLQVTDQSARSIARRAYEQDVHRWNGLKRAPHQDALNVRQLSKNCLAFRTEEVELIGLQSEQELAVVERIPA